MNKQLHWRDNSPFNDQYQDIYFSPDNGLAESRHVFLEGNDLSRRWAKLGGAETFTIFEAGFGSGLNFLTTWQLWRTSKPAGRLRYVSIENNPFNKNQYAQALAPFSNELSELIPSYLEKMSRINSGNNIVQFETNVALQLINADISLLHTNLPECPDIDAIFLDGFSPATNPEMWSLELSATLFENSKHNATLATFSVAGLVKRNLKAAGFVIEKAPGFGKKREMLRAYKAVT